MGVPARNGVDSMVGHGNVSGKDYESIVSFGECGAA